MRVALIKYNAGNIQSVSYALERLGVNFVVTADPESIQKADKVIFPGVGEASTTMNYLKENQLDQIIVNLKQPVLGICLGMQLMCRFSEENDTPCLGIFEETVKKFIPTSDQKVPHMGWNSLEKVSDWFTSNLEGQYVYYVHSYYVPANPHSVAQTQYTVPFSAAMRKNNFYAVQFHPEKSAAAGEQVLKSFLNSI
jgi:imidazole glycerol-phosphate synthase subunit HisH